MLVAAAGLVMVIGMGSAPTAQTTYDLLKEWPKAKVENQMGEASVRQITSGGVKLNSISLCPSKQRATATYELILPRGNVDERLALTFQVGLDDNLTQEDKQIQSDGVRFFVDINGLTVFTSDNTSPGWGPCSIDLTKYAGQTIRLVFSTDSKANTNFDWASIAVPRITRLGGTTSSITKMTKGILEVRSTKAEVVTVEMDGPNGRAVSKVSLPVTPSSSFYYPVDGLQGKYDFVKVVGSTSAKLFYYPFKPQMKLSSVTASKGLVTLGETFEVRAIVRNDGEGVYEGGKSRIGLGNASGLQILERREQPIGSLLPGQTAVYKWAAKATSIQNPNNILVKMLGEQMDAMVGIIPVAPPPPTITKQGLAAVAYNSTAYIQNETMRLVFQRSSEGSAARIYAKTASGWTQVAVWSPLTLILGNGSGAPTRTYTLRLNHTSASVYGTTAAVRLRGETSDLWAMEVECRLQKGSRAAQLIAHIKPRVGADIKAICFPDIKVADSPLGVKEAALFPGLEYLFQDEASGKPSEGNLLGTPWSPHIYKITAPLMAVRLRSALVALNWEPLQDWATGYNGLSAQFSSPNSLENEDNHKMALWVPSVRDVADEDTFPAQRPFYLGAGTPITITANLVVLPNSSSLLDIVDWYVSAKGLPSLPAPSHSGISAIDFLTQGLINSYDPDQKAWRHSNTGPVSFDPVVALPLLMQSRITNNSDLRLRALAQIKESVEKVGIGSTGVMAFHLGDIEKALAAMRKDVEGLIRSQKADGSWAWTPLTERHKVLGRAGDTSSGYSGANAAIVWEYARITGDLAAMEAGRKALRFLDTLSRPEGAQTWELPLHVPDLLASANCVNAYFRAFQITGEKRYLDRARYWARTGLPFIYLWSAYDRPIMRYASIPAFGVSWQNSQPWYGNAVQWVGLEYARALMRLAPYDNKTNWAKVAEGITLCGLQQAEYIASEYSSDAGMYPDAYSIVKGKEEYHLDLNPRLLALNLLILNNADPFIHSAHVRDVVVSTVGILSPLELKGSELAFTIGYYPYTQTAVLVSNTNKPSGVEADSRQINEITDLNTVESGWKYLPDSRQLIIKLNHASNRTGVKVRL